jgi:hypothetical protein
MGIAQGPTYLIKQFEGGREIPRAMLQGFRQAAPPHQGRDQVCTLRVPPVVEQAQDVGVL